MTKDPVCGMAVAEGQAAATATHKGQTYYFCSEGCKNKFLQDPTRYTDSARPSPH